MLTDIDGHGGFLMPSLIDSEGHFTLSNEMLRDVIEEGPAKCFVKNGVRYPILSKAELVKEFSEKGLLKEVDTHGLIQSNLWEPRKIGQVYEIPQSANFEKHLRFGVTTVFDMHSNPWPASYIRRSNGKWGKTKGEEQRDLKKQFLIYADLFYPSMWAMPHNVQFHYFGVDPVYNLMPDGPWSERDIYNWVARRKAEGAYHIKIFYDSARGVLKTPNFFTNKTLATLVKAAHHFGLYAVSHVQDETLVENALNAGFDGFMHVPGDNKELLSGEIRKKMQRKLKFDVATLQTLSMRCDNPNQATLLLKNVLESSKILPYINGLDEIRMASCIAPSDKLVNYEILFQNVAALADDGVMLLSGVDGGDEIAPLVEGLGIHFEMAMLKTALKRYSKKYSSDQASTLFALKAATSNPARAFGMHLENGHKSIVDPRGFVKKAYRADLLLLSQSPFDNIQNTLNIKSVWKAGYEINRQMVRPSCRDSNCETRQIIEKAVLAACPK